MKKDIYVFTSATVALVLKALDLNTTHSCEGDDWNDEEVIAALNAMNQEIQANEDGCD